MLNLLAAFKGKKVLILSPHTDDGEIGCGASINKLITIGADVRYIAFSAAEESVPDQFPKDILRKEVLHATEILGIKSQNVQVLNYSVRHFPAYRQEILEDLIKIRNQINPDLVFIPSLNDFHQDHQVISLEGLRAFKRANLLGYELPWNNLISGAPCFIQVSEENLGKKIEALKCYQSQSHRSYVTEDFIKSQVVMRGTQSSLGLAEAFEVVRWHLI